MALCIGVGSWRRVLYGAFYRYTVRYRGIDGEDRAMVGEGAR